MTVNAQSVDSDEIARNVGAKISEAARAATEDNDSSIKR